MKEIKGELRKFIDRVWDEVIEFGNEFNQAIIMPNGTCEVVFSDGTGDNVRDTDDLLRYIVRDCIESLDSEYYFDVKEAVNGLQEGEALYIAYGSHHYTDDFIIEKFETADDVERLEKEVLG